MTKSLKRTFLSLNNMVSYEDSGVNVELGGDVSKILYNAAKETWKNREGKLGELIVPVDTFSGIRAINVSNLPTGTLMNMGFDGVGTKMELAERIGDHTTIAYDLFAMVCDDAVVRGAEPVIIGSILDVNSLGKGKSTFINEIKQLAQGYIGAANEARVAVVNGEVAELGNRVGGFGNFNYNWGASVVWFARKERMFTGFEIKPGDSLVGFEEKGFRSNGLSLVRKIMEQNYGTNWHKTGFGDINFAKLALEPSKIYTRAVVDMFGGYQGEPKASLSGVAHITGGGIPEKLRRLLEPKGLGAKINFPCNVPELMRHCQKIGNVSDEEAYKTWNMGQGMIVSTSNPGEVINVAEEYGIKAKLIGEVTKEPSIQIRSNGIHSNGQILKF